MLDFVNGAISARRPNLLEFRRFEEDHKLGPGLVENALRFAGRLTHQLLQPTLDVAIDLVVKGKDALNRREAT